LNTLLNQWCNGASYNPMENSMSEETFPALSRRTFVKQSAITAGGVLAASALAPNAPGAAWGDREVKVALIGCGGRGTGAASQALRTKSNVKLVAMADAFSDRLNSSLQTITKQHPDKVQVPDENKFVGFDGYLKAIEKADMVILTTPPGFRPMQYEAAIKAGKHVFMEKPVAVDGPGVRMVLEATEKAKAQNLKVVVGLQRRYDLKYQAAIQQIRDGALGDILAGRVYWNGGGVWVKNREPGDTEMQYQMRNWYYFLWLCGDHIAEQHIHNLDVFNWVKDAYPVRCNAQGGRQVRTGKEFGEIYDHHFVEYEYADGSVCHSQCRHIKNTMSRVAEFVQGTKGRGWVDRAQFDDNAGQRIWAYNGPKNDAYQSEHDVLFEHIRTGEPINDGEYGAKSTLTSVMGRMASYSGQIVTWEQALNSSENTMPARLAWDANPPTLPDDSGFYKIAMPGVWKFS